MSDAAGDGSSSSIADAREVALRWDAALAAANVRFLASLNSSSSSSSSQTTSAAAANSADAGVVSAERLAAARRRAARSSDDSDGDDSDDGSDDGSGGNGSSSDDGAAVQAVSEAEWAWLLRDGHVLCAAAEALAAAAQAALGSSSSGSSSASSSQVATVPTVKWTRGATGAFKQRANAANYLAWAGGALALPAATLFDTVELFERQAPRKVLMHVDLLRRERTRLEAHLCDVARAGAGAGAGAGGGGGGKAGPAAAAGGAAARAGPASSASGAAGAGGGGGKAGADAGGGEKKKGVFGLGARAKSPSGPGSGDRGRTLGDRGGSLSAAMVAQARPNFQCKACKARVLGVTTWPKFCKECGAKNEQPIPAVLVAQQELRAQQEAAGGSGDGLSAAAAAAGGADDQVGTLDDDVRAKESLKSNPELERMTLVWLTAVLGPGAIEKETEAVRRRRKKDGDDAAPVASEPSLEELLRSGVLLCNLANEIVPGFVKRIHASDIAFQHIENVAAYLRACANIGVGESDIFDPSDLVEGKNFNAVVANTHVVARRAAKMDSYIKAGKPKMEAEDTSKTRNLYSALLVGDDLASAGAGASSAPESDAEAKLVEWVNRQLADAYEAEMESGGAAAGAGAGAGAGGSGAAAAGGRAAAVAMGSRRDSVASAGSTGSRGSGGSSSTAAAVGNLPEALLVRNLGPDLRDGEKLLRLVDAVLHESTMPPLEAELPVVPAAASASASASAAAAAAGGAGAGAGAPSRRQLRRGGTRSALEAMRNHTHLLRRVSTATGGTDVERTVRCTPRDIVAGDRAAIGRLIEFMREKFDPAFLFEQLLAKELADAEGAEGAEGSAAADNDAARMARLLAAGALFEDDEAAALAGTSRAGDDLDDDISSGDDEGEDSDFDSGAESDDDEGASAKPSGSGGKPPKGAKADAKAKADDAKAKADDAKAAAAAAKQKQQEEEEAAAAAAASAAAAETADAGKAGKGSKKGGKTDKKKGGSSSSGSVATAPDGGKTSKASKKEAKASSRADKKAARASKKEARASKRLSKKAGKKGGTGDSTTTTAETAADTAASPGATKADKKTSRSSRRNTGRSPSKDKQGKRADSDEAAAGAAAIEAATTEDKPQTEKAEVKDAGDEDESEDAAAEQERRAARRRKHEMEKLERKRSQKLARQQARRLERKQTVLKARSQADMKAARQALAEREKVERAQAAVRQKIVAEVLSTENSYVQSLLTVDAFRRRVVQANVLTAVELEAVFSTLGELAKVHTRWLGCVQERLQRDKDDGASAAAAGGAGGDEGPGGRSVEAFVGGMSVSMGISGLPRTSSGLDRDAAAVGGGGSGGGKGSRSDSQSLSVSLPPSGSAGRKSRSRSGSSVGGGSSGESTPRRSRASGGSSPKPAMADSLHARVLDAGDGVPCIADLISYDAQTDASEIPAPSFTLASFLDDVYRPYIHNYPVSVATVHFLVETNQPFAALVKEFEAEQQNLTRLPLDGFLIVPVQRLPRYVMLLRDAAKYTPVRFSEHRRLVSATDLVDAQLKDINASMDRKSLESLQRTLAVARSIDGCPADVLGRFIVPGRLLLHEGSISVGVLLPIVDMHALARSKEFVPESPCRVRTRPSAETKAEKSLVDHFDFSWKSLPKKDFSGGKASEPKPYMFVWEDLIVMCDPKKEADGEKVCDYAKHIDASHVKGVMTADSWAVEMGWETKDQQAERKRRRATMAASGETEDESDPAFMRGLARRVSLPSGWDWDECVVVTIEDGSVVLLRGSTPREATQMLNAFLLVFMRRAKRAAIETAEKQRSAANSPAPGSPGGPPAEKPGDIPEDLPSRQQLQQLGGLRGKLLRERVTLSKIVDDAEAGKRAPEQDADTARARLVELNKHLDEIAERVTSMSRAGGAGSRVGSRYSTASSASSAASSPAAPSKRKG